jgi:hypothetical protein
LEITKRNGRQEEKEKKVGEGQEVTMIKRAEKNGEEMDEKVVQQWK